MPVDEQQLVDLRSKVSEAINEFLSSRHAALLREDANERSITHHFACVLAKLLPDYDVDVEYNRAGEMRNTKRLEFRLENTDELPKGQDPRLDEHAHTVYPDVIVHLRSSDENIVVVEVKKRNGSGVQKDMAKLRAFTHQEKMTDEGESYQYRLGLFLLFDVGEKVPNEGKVAALALWFADGTTLDDDRWQEFSAPYPVATHGDNLS